MQASFWRNRRVFITGHTGFKGSWLWQILADLGATLKGYALAPPSPGLFEQIEGASLGESVLADLRDAQRLEAEVLAFEPEFVFHLAAQPLVLEAYKNPLYTLDVNVQGTAHLLEALRKLKNPCVSVFITTDKVYENKEWVWPYRESDALGGYDLYSSSKACSELVIASYRSSFFNPEAYAQHGQAVATARAGNVIGGGDWADFRILPDAVRAWQKGEVLDLRNPRAIRPWQHVLEALNGYLMLAEALYESPKLHAHAYNFGPLYDEAIDVETVVRWASETWGGGNYRVQVNPNQAHEAQLLRLDCSLSVQSLGWKPRWNAQEAVAQTLAWYRAVIQDGAEPAAYCKQQIKSFFDK